MAYIIFGLILFVGCFGCILGFGVLPKNKKDEFLQFINSL